MCHPTSLRRRRARFLVAGFVLVGSMALSACTGFVGSGQDSRGDSSNPGIQISSLRPKQTAALNPYYAQTVHWTTCHRSYLCATVQAPVDWQHVTSASITLALIKHSATGTSKGDLVVNPGGPGASGVDFVDEGVDGVVDSTAARDYNVIGFDPRGVGASTAVKCYDDAGTDKYLYGIDPGAIGSAEWIAAEKKKSRDLAAACEKNTGPVLGHIDTINAAADMDVIRAALGDAKLNFLGYSYGTYLGTIYAGLFPSRVGKMVLDGADDPWGANYAPSDPSDNSDDFGVDPADDSAVAQAMGFEDALSDYLSSCLSNASATVGVLRCPFLSSLSNAKSRVAGFLSSAAAHPLTDSNGRVMGAAALATAIDDALYDPTDWPDLTRMFVQVQDGNPSEAFELADDYNDRNPDGSYDDNADLANLAIGCLEEGPAVDLKFDRREATELRKVAPILGIYSAYGDLVCSGWPFGPSVFPNPVHADGTGPILVLGTTGDPATPYADAKNLAQQLDSGYLVTFHGQGHTAYDRGDECIDGTVDDYLLKGTVPFDDPQCH
jgi:pimeloyl-ACP methyl ester carboxylesterase